MWHHHLSGFAPIVLLLCAIVVLALFAGRDL